MGIIDNALDGFGTLFKPSRSTQMNPVNLNAGNKKDQKVTLPWKSKSIPKTQNDIQIWKSAQQIFNAEEDPKSYPLHNLYDDIMIDSHLTSQIGLRKAALFGVGFSLKKPSGEVDEEQTKLLKKMPLFRQVTRAILDSTYRGFMVGQIKVKADIENKLQWHFETIPNQHIVPRLGRFYTDYTEDNFILYREIPEYGRWVLEFEGESLGVLNKAVPHVLFKKFAQSAWSELGEIYGIPPRSMKTNTQDPGMLARAEQMMDDLGSAAWFIIDQSEDFEFAKAVDTNGDMFQNLMGVCNNEMSTLICGAIIGQDTKNGSNAKEKALQALLSSYVDDDIIFAEQNWNSIVIPALKAAGLLKGELSLEFDPVENIEELWNRTIEAMQYGTPDLEWMNSKFGIQFVEIHSKENQSANLNFDPDFFV